MGAFEEGSAFLAGVLAKVPETLRAQVKEALEKPEAKDAVVLLGDGVLARSDYSKHMDALQKQEAALKKQEADLKAAADARLAELNEWYGVNKAALDEYKVLKANNGGKKPDDDDEKPPVDPRKVAEDVVNEAGREYISVAAWLEDKGAEHRDLFGERLNTSELVANPKLGKPIVGQPGRIFSLNDAYMEKYGEKVAAKQKELHDKSINDEVEKRLKEERSKQVIAGPYPLRGEIGPSVLDTLDTKEGPAAHTLDTAVSLYDQLQAGKGA